MRVIHRDLKPANTKITPEGKPKILDFGLAKATERKSPTSNLSESPTVTRGTAVGVILGTAPYMSPEQARWQTVDKRTDIWAFGCCLYEALAGKLAFPGETVTDTLARIVEREPDWKALPNRTPSSIHRLLRRCLSKTAADRLQHIGDARIEIADALTTPLEAPTQSSPSAAVVVLALTTVLATGVALWSLVRSSAPVPKPVV